MKNRKRFLSLMISLGMLFSLLICPEPVFAGNGFDASSGKVSPEEWLPDIITEEEAAENGYAFRLAEAEPDLNTLVFRNADGTNTMRIFDHPVKYLDETGAVKDITLDIGASQTGFVSEQNAVRTEFSKMLSEGITLAYDDIGITLIPQQAVPEETEKKTAFTASLSADKRTVTYPYGEKTTFEYSLTYTGFKEDIVVSEYTGQTEYYFLLNTNGLVLEKLDGSYYLTDGEGEIRAAVGDIIIFTADERNNAFGSMTHETVKEGKQYILTIHIDGDYLKDEKTVYPIRIDPTIEINYDNNGAGAIEDVTLNSLDSSAPNSGSLFVGKRETYGISRTLMRFPALDLSVIGTSDQIVSARVELRDLMCYSTQLPVSCHTFKSTWNISTVRWSNASPNNYVSAALDSKTVYYRNGDYAITGNYARYSFNITGAVKAWKNGTYSKDCGVIFKTTSAVETGSTNISVCFASYNRSSNKPSFTMEYINSVPLLITDNICLESGETQQMVCSYPNGENITATYLVENPGVATVSASGLVTAHADGVTSVLVTFKRSDGTSVRSQYGSILVGSERYIFFQEDGKAISAPSDTVFSSKKYSGSDRDIRWVLINAGSANVYYIVPRYRPSRCLTAASSGTVTLSSRLNYDYQKWKLIIDSQGARLQTMSSDSNISGLYLKKGSDSSYVLSTAHSVLGPAFVDSFVPCNSISMSDLELHYTLSGRYITPSFSPSNSSYKSGSWIQMTSSNPSVISVDSPEHIQIHSTGSSTLTIVHKVSGKSCICTVVVDDYNAYVIDFNENKVFNLYELSSSSVKKYLEVQSNENIEYPQSGCGLESNAPIVENTTYTELSHQMWRFKKCPGTSFYIISPMHSNNQVIFCNSSNQIKTYVTTSSTYGTDFWDEIDGDMMWGIKCDSSSKKYRIFPASDITKSLAYNSSGLAVCTNGVNAYMWEIKLYENDAYREGRCCNYPTPVNVYVTVDIQPNSNNYLVNTINWDLTKISYDQMEQAVEAWNGISSKVNIEFVRPGESAGDRILLAKFVAMPTTLINDSGGMELSPLGMAIPVDAYSGEVYRSSLDLQKLEADWLSTIIYININETAEKGEQGMKSILMHEVGHALKLKHTVEYQEISKKLTFPSLMMPKMEVNATHYQTSSMWYSSYEITNFDTSALIAKWRE